MKKLFIISILISIFFLTQTAVAAVVTLNLDQIADLCNTPWVESEVILTVIPTIQNDFCPGQCIFNSGNVGNDLGILLNSGRLNLNVSMIDDPISNVEIDVIDYCSPTGCTAAFLYSGTTVVDNTLSQPGADTLTLSSPANSTVDKIVVSSCDGFIGEIRITLSTTTPTDTTCIAGCGTTSSTCRGWGCGGITLSTCSGLSCGGNTLYTCGLYGCGGLFAGLSTGSTYTTCKACGPLLSSAIFNISGTYTTCNYSAYSPFRSSGIFGTGGTYITCNYSAYSPFTSSGIFGTGGILPTYGTCSNCNALYGLSYGTRTVISTYSSPVSPPAF